MSNNKYLCAEYCILNLLEYPKITGGSVFMKNSSSAIAGILGFGIVVALMFYSWVAAIAVGITLLVPLYVYIKCKTKHYF